MNVAIEERAATRLGCIRHIGPYYEIGNSFAHLGKEIAGSGISHDRLGEMVAVYYDDPNTTAPNELKSDACIVVHEGVALPSALSEHRLANGRYAVATHMGSYEGLGDAWAQLYGKDLPANGLRWLDAPCFEIYRNDCTKVPQEELRTDLYVPLQV